MFIKRQIDTGLFFELLHDVLDYSVIKVVTAEKSITIGGLNFKNTITQFENGDVKSAASKVVNGDGFVFALIQSIGQSGGSGFVDDSLDIESGDFTGLFSSLALRVVKVSRNGNDSIGNGSSQIGLGIGLGFLKNLG